MASGYVDIQVFALGEFHRNINGICNYCDIEILGKASNYFRSRGSGSKCDRLAGSNQCSGSSCNAALFICEFLNLRLKGAVIAERLVKQRLDGDSPAMGSAQSAILLQ